VPYSKSLDITQFEERPYDIGFVMVSKSVGETILDQVVDSEGMLQFQIEVNNQDNGNIHVPCGIIEGETEELIIIGAHHDTVYNGQGAVDNTAGTATVMEMARQFGLLQSDLGEPRVTIYFCTWGGEEEGLWGSSEWVDKHREVLEENLRLYINLDMNHVDAERNSGLTLQGNSVSDVKHIEGLVREFSATYPNLSEKYSISVRELGSEQMPYNSDHAPFVFGIHQDSDDDFGLAMMCYGSGSSEYHTYLDNMDRFNEESLMVSGIIYGSLVKHLAWG
jgi:Zn-dependent M28 family amino/carboxypeptidase